MVILFAIVMTAWLLGASFALLGLILDSSAITTLAKVTLLSAFAISIISLIIGLWIEALV